MESRGVIYRVVRGLENAERWRARRFGELDREDSRVLQRLPHGHG
jgi:hypothetical protein